MDVYVKNVIPIQSSDNNAGGATIQLGADELHFKNGQRVRVGTDTKSMPGTYVTLSSTSSGL